MLYRNAKKGESLKYQPGVKSMRDPFAVFADRESLLRKKIFAKITQVNHQHHKKNKHEMCRYSLFTNCSFDENKSVIHYYSGKDCLKKFCQDLRKQARSIVVGKKKK